MNVIRVTSAAVLGVDASLIQVEVDLAYGIQAFHTVGLPDGAVREARVRVQSAIKNSDLEWPVRRVTVNLAPADLRKEGTGFDLPIALALLASSGQCAASGEGWSIEQFMVVGELSLDGQVRPVRGVLPMAIAAHEAGLQGLILPHGNAREASVVEGLAVLPVTHLREVVEFFRGERDLPEAPPSDVWSDLDEPTYPFDFAEVRGQEQARRAIEVAMAGGHSALMIGAPGSGKTMIARRAPTIAPRMTFREALETTKIYSVMGLLADDVGLITQRPFRAPHHTISSVGLVGGGNGVPRPGEVSLAHNGVLFLDELPEFQRRTLEVLRQPLEDQEVTVSRSLVSLTYPASVVLIGAMNPCPCGYQNSGSETRQCRCTPWQIERYQARLSGPLLDRIDIHIEVPAVRYSDLRDAGAGESSATIRKRVQAARTIQRERFEGLDLHCNAQMRPRELELFCAIDDAGHKLLERVVDRLGMSARTFSRILKVARTIADLDGEEDIQTPHLAEAIQYRLLDRQQSPY
ncbi:MAG: ATP-dependent protease [Myxococcales bacterium]|nr:ATP-dependent protease [Myxococcales bacterium]